MRLRQQSPARHHVDLAAVSVMPQREQGIHRGQVLLDLF
jgi:hypothetical protein